MSHNNNKVNAQEPNREGEISQALGDLSDVSATAPTEGQYLQWDNTAGEWQPKDGTAGSTAAAEHIWIGEGASSTHAAAGWAASSANTGQNPEIAQALFELAEESDVRVNIQSTASLGTASTNQGLYGFIFIMKVG